MRIIAVETTPNPNSLKFTFDESTNSSATFTTADLNNCPDHVKKILAVAGVKSVFVCADFITVNRDPRSDWNSIVNGITRALPNDLDGVAGAEANGATTINEQRAAAEKSGRATVLVQTFRGIPIQVKVVEGTAEKRLALSKRFSDAALMVQQKSGADYLKERYWADWGIRYGSIDEIAADVVEEIEGTIDATTLRRRSENALNAASQDAGRNETSIVQDLASPDWHTRLRAVQELPTSPENTQRLIKSLQDDNHQVRRFVAAALGGTGEIAAVEPLCNIILNDPSIAVRRTAGDALSDLGFVDAQPAMCKALSDPNKLVRWRAARFLAEVGTQFSLIFLNRAANDEAYEVRLEVAAAIDRITSAKEGALPMWKRLLN